MTITVKHDISDIANEVVDECTERTSKLVTAAINDITQKLRESLDDMLSGLSTALKIDDPKRLDRLRKAFNHNLDKWSREIVKC